MLKIDASELNELLERMTNENPLIADLLHTDLSRDPYGIDMIDLSALMLVFHLNKDANYGRSWARRGKLGVYHNVLRKADRLDKLAKLSMIGNDNQMSVALIDTLLDLSIYCQMWVCYLAKTDPHSFNSWIQKVWCPATGIPFVDVSYILPQEED